MNAIRLDRQRTVCSKVASAHSGAFQTAKLLLDELKKSHARISLDYVPLETYAKEQSVRLISDILKKLTDLTMTTEDVKNHIENIVASFKLYHKQHSTEGAAMAMKCLRSFIYATAELCNLFELVNNEEITNWHTCANLCERPLRALNFRPVYPAVDFIPRIEDFESVRMLGGGGFGAVYEARYVPTNTTVCVKLILLKRLQKISFASLDKILASVTEHVKLVQYFASFLTTEAYVTVMECVQGVDLIRFIEIHGEFPAERSVIVIQQMVKAISHLHAHGFIHRDIKPLNTLLLPGGHIKVIDFDTCKICMAHFLNTRPLPSYFAQTADEFSDNDFAGTVTFLPPEVLQRRAYGRAMDWWAIGVTTFRLMVGRLPFKAKDRQRLKDAIVGENPRFPKHLGAIHKDFISRLLRKNALERLGSRNYTELIGHKFFEGIETDLPPTAVYFDTSVTAREQKLQSSLKPILQHSKPIDNKDGKYVTLRNCDSIKKSDQKNLLTFASQSWRKLMCPDLSVGPPVTEQRGIRELSFLLAHQTSEAKTYIPGYGEPRHSIDYDSAVVESSISIETAKDQPVDDKHSPAKLSAEMNKCRLS